MSRYTLEPRRWHITGQGVKRLTILSFVLILSACGGDSGDGPASEPEGAATDPANEGIDNPPDVDVPPVVDVSDPTQCNAATQKQWAYNSMRDFYLFYDQVPVVDPQSFDSADELVRSVRFQERDTFSNVGNATQLALQFDEGREFGLGYRWTSDNQSNARIALVIDESPFGQAGIERGDIILAVDGFDWSDETLDTGFGERVLGTPENPATAIWRFRKRDTGNIVELPITAAEYGINTVLEASTITSDSVAGVAGYLAFNQFLNTSEQELNQVFNQFRARNITELVLDLRYNGGGRVRIAQQLASLVAGNSNSGKALVNYRFNDQYTDNNFSLELLANVGDLGLSRVVVLTTQRTASASELVISGLQPHMEVITMGSRTIGKPYIQYAYDRCDERLALIEAEGFNDADVSVFGGIPALCFATDDPTRDFGVSDDGTVEGFLLSALDYLVNGTCATAPVSASESLSTRAVPAEYELDRQGVFPVGGAFAE